jgi:replicative DNA helicase
MNNTVQKLPFSEEGERAIISSVFLDGIDSLSKAIDAKITEDCFFVTDHRKIWVAILKQHRDGKPLEVSAVAEEMKAGGLLQEIGGYTGLVSASSSIHTTAQLSYWLVNVRHHFVMRQMHQSALVILESIQDRSATVDSFVKEMQGIISVHSAVEKQVSVSDAASEALAMVDKACDGSIVHVEVGNPFPWMDWNVRFGTAKAGELIIVAARPSIGKSSLARQIAWEWSKTGRVMLFSREMTVSQIVPLLAQTESEVSWNMIMKRAALPKDHIDRFRKQLVSIKENVRNIDVYDTDRTLTHLVTRARSFSRHACKAIVIDYLQRYDAEQGKGETRDIALGRFTMAMKDLAVELRIPVILLAQLGRSVERENREPRMSDLRESGNLEQDADRLIFLNAPDYRPDGVLQNITDNDVRSVYIDAIQAKGRSEGTGRCAMTFERSITKFRPYTIL